MSLVSYLAPSSERVRFEIKQEELGEIHKTTLDNVVDWAVYDLACEIFKKVSKGHTGELGLVLNLRCTYGHNIAPETYQVRKEIGDLIVDKLRLLCFENNEHTKLQFTGSKNQKEKCNVLIPAICFNFFKQPDIPRPVSQPHAISTEIYQLYLAEPKESHTDVKLKTGSKGILCHKTVLVARSIMFNRMFSNPTKEAQAGEISIECSYEAVKLFVEYLYTDDVRNFPKEVDVVREVLNLAQQHFLKKLKTLCSIVLCRIISEKTFLHIAKMAETYELGKLKCFCIAKLEIDSLLKEEVDTHFIYVIQTIARQILQMGIQESTYEEKYRVGVEIVKDLVTYYNLPNSKKWLQRLNSFSEIRALDAGTSLFVSQISGVTNQENVDSQKALPKDE